MKLQNWILFTKMSPTVHFGTILLNLTNLAPCALLSTIWTSLHIIKAVYPNPITKTSPQVQFEKIQLNLPQFGTIVHYTSHNLCCRTDSYEQNWVLLPTLGGLGTIWHFNISFWGKYMTKLQNAPGKWNNNPKHPLHLGIFQIWKNFKELLLCFLSLQKMITWLDYKPSPRRLSICLSQREEQTIAAQSVTPKYHHWVSCFYFLFECWKVLNLLCFYSTQIDHLNGLQTIIKLWTYCLWETVLSKKIRDSQHVLNIESPALAQLSTIPHN